MSDALPPGFPINTLPLQRALVAVALARPERLEDAIERLWRDVWVEWREPLREENLRKALVEVLGSEGDAEQVLQAAAGERVKRVLSENTAAAFGEGAFGLPWFVGEFFFMLRSTF